MPPHTHHFRTGFSSQEYPVIKCEFRSTITEKGRHFYLGQGNRSWVFTDMRCSLSNHITRRVCETGHWCCFLLFSQGVRSAGCMMVPSTAIGSRRQSCWWETCSCFCLTQRLLAHVHWSISMQTGITSTSFIPMTNLDSLDILILGNHISPLQLPHSFPTQNLKHLDFQMNHIRAITAADVQALQKTSNVTLILKGNDITYIEPGSFQSHFYSLDLVDCAGIPGLLVGIQNSTAQTLRLGTFLRCGKGALHKPRCFTRPL